MTAGSDLDLRSPAPIDRLGDISSAGSQSGTIRLTSGGTLTSEDFRIVSRISGEGIGSDILFSAEAIDFNETSIASLTRDESQADLGFDQDAIGGSIFIETTEGVTLQNSNIFTDADFGTADAGNVTLNAQQLKISSSLGFRFPFGDGGFGIFAFAGPESTGDGGDINVEVAGTVDLSGPLSGVFAPKIEQAEVEAAFTEIITSGATLFTNAFGGGSAGDISLQAGRLNLQNGAGLITVAVLDEGGDISIVAGETALQGLAVISSGTSVVGQDAGDIEMEASRLTLTDGAIISASSFGAGDAGDLSLSVQQLSVERGSSISTTAFSSGEGGDLTLRASDRISLSGTTADNSFASSIAASSLGEGNAGLLRIITPQLTVDSGAEITTATVASGTGADIQIDTGTLNLDNARINATTATTKPGGNIRIQADEQVTITGDGFDLLTQQIIAPALAGTVGVNNFTQGILTITAGDGDAGSVRIETPEFVASNGALVAASTLGTGAGGNIDIVADNDLQLNGSLLATGTFTSDAPSGDINLRTRRLRAEGGAQAITTTFGAGKAGNLTVLASESIDLIDPTESGIASGLLASSFQTAAGTGGDIRVDTTDFRILDGATVSVSGEGAGDAGNIDVGARSLFLNRGFITATSASGEGGNIRLNIEDVMSLRNGSEISTTAGQAEAGGNGGNITFADGIILAIPQEDSDITANAFEGRGGNISITTQGLFGTEFRDNLSPLSDITASSEAGLNGEVQIELIETDLQPVPVELPTQVASDNRVAARCGTLENEENALVVTGRGGLPTDPRRLLQGEMILSDARGSGAITSESITNSEIVEAQGWGVDAQGRVQLLAMSEQVPRMAVTCATKQASDSE